MSYSGWLRSCEWHPGSARFLAKCRGSTCPRARCQAVGDRMSGYVKVGQVDTAVAFAESASAGVTFRYVFDLPSSSMTAFWSSRCVSVHPECEFLNGYR